MAMSQNKQIISKEDIHNDDINKHLERVHQEFADGFEFLKKYPRSVTIFGSSQAKPENEHYKKAEELGMRIVKELDYAVITGGGPGIMQAANKGAFMAGGHSIGLNISIPNERTTNEYCTHAIKFSYFFSRKTMLTFAAEAYVFFPGGFGTLDELFSILTLIQTEKIPRVPIILYDPSFWNNIINLFKNTLLEKYKTISHKDLGLFEVVDSTDRVIDIIHKAPLSEWWRNIN